MLSQSHACKLRSTHLTAYNYASRFFKEIWEISFYFFFTFPGNRIGLILFWSVAENVTNSALTGSCWWQETVSQYFRKRICHSMTKDQYQCQMITITKLIKCHSGAFSLSEPSSNKWIIVNPGHYQHTFNTLKRTRSDFILGTRTGQEVGIAL